MSKVTKKWSTNPKYRNVKPVVDSGFTIRKYLESIEELHRNFKFSKDEIFRRIKLETFVRLVLEVWMARLDPEKGENIPQREQIETGDNVNDSSASPEMPNSSSSSSIGTDIPSMDRMLTARSTLHSVISGIGELDLTKGGSDRVQDTTARDLPERLLYEQQPYLLLDVRDPDDYNRCHIISALNYPHTMLSRVMNYESKELLNFKNKGGCIIIVYDEDETISQKVATTLVQRGYDNVYLLSGGLNLAWRRFSDALVTGSLPQTPGRTDGARGANRATENIPTKPTFLQDDFALNQLHRLEREISFYLTNTSGTSLGRNLPVAVRTARRSRDDYETSPRQEQRYRKPWK